MPDIRPFRGIFYNRQRVHLPDVVAPPYDVISPERQDALYKGSPHNIVRLILGREADPYSSAATLFTTWKQEGVMVADSVPAVYVLSQSFHLPDRRTHERIGFIAACRLEESRTGTIFPHERTHSKPKEDRLKLYHSTGAMFSQIFALYGDEGLGMRGQLRRAMKSSADMDVEFEGVRNRVWRLTEGAAIREMSNFLKGRNVYIADGHHRYETALAYRDSMRRENKNQGGAEPYNYAPVYFTGIDDDSLVILPTHRIVHGLQNFEAGTFVEKLKSWFHLDVCASVEELKRGMSERGRRTIGLILPRFPFYVLLWLKDFSSVKEPGLPEPVAKLDVSILHSLVLKGVLGISEEAQDKKMNIEYEKDAGSAIQAVKDGKAQAAFILNPTPVGELRAVADAGFTMPQKSTYFYPKLLSGLVTYSFTEQ